MNKIYLFVSVLLLAMPVFAQDQPLLMDEEDLNFNLSEDAFGNTLRPNISDDDIKVNPKQSLSQNLKNNTKEADVEPAPKPVDTTSGKSDEGKTWVSGVKSLFTGGDKSKELLDETKKFTKEKRSNASVFDIAGVMLKMSYQEAEKELLRRGYKKASQKMDVPNFIRWRNEEKCRNEGVVGYERLESCIVKLAQKNNYYYIASAIFNKFDTKETVEIFLSSTFTGNKIYRITYQTEAAGNRGNSAKAVYLRNLKVYDFWKKINQKYGFPDDEQNAVWGLGNESPYLKASTGYLRLEDPLFKTLDINRMSMEDQKFIHTDSYTF